MIRNALCLFYVTFLFCVNVNAQEVQNLNFKQEDLDKLILQAIQNNSSLDILQSKVDILDNQIKIQNAEHLGLFFVSGNLNEYSLQEFGIGGDPDSAAGSLFFPRYNVGVNINLNHFSNVKNQKEILKKNQEIIFGESDILQEQIAATVIKAYYNYLMAKDIVKIKRQIEQFDMADFDAVETKFSEGDAELEEYSISRKNYFDSKLKLIEAEKNYLDAKADLEALINTSLESLGIE